MTFLKIIDNIVTTCLWDTYGSLASIILVHGGTGWFAFTLFSLLTEIFEILALYYFFFFFAGLVLFYRNTLFQVFSNLIIKFNFYNNTLLFLNKTNIFFKTYLNQITKIFTSIKNFFKNK